MNDEADVVQIDEALGDSPQDLEDYCDLLEETTPEEEELTDSAAGEELGEESEEASEEAPEEEPEEAPEEDFSSEAEELSLIRSEITKLKEELRRLDELKAQSQRMLREFDEFLELFPDKRIESIPDEVWAQARSGVSLAAAYALYEKKREVGRRLASEINAKNAALSAGKAGNDAAGEYFSCEQVRQMSQAEIRKNYTKIRESMKKWN